MMDVSANSRQPSPADEAVAGLAQALGYLETEYTRGGLDLLAFARIRSSRESVIRAIEQLQHYTTTHAD